MEITILIENTSHSELLAEHGLSVLIEYNGKRYLLDAGSSDAFLENAKTLGISLDNLDACILSHGHYDHSGGFHALLNANETVSVYAMESAVTDSYHSSKGGMHEIGVPSVVLDNHSERFILLDSSKTIDGIHLIPHSSRDLELIGQKAGLFKKIDDKYLPDDFSHELSLVFDTPKGLVIFNSCSHAGILNIISEVKATFPGRNIYAFLGGLHMEGKKEGRSYCTFSEDEIADISNSLKADGLQYIYTGHCTGEEGFRLIRKHFGENAVQIYTGMKITI
ncbi:MAG: MBL fold metallo-hydrolase [Lachnospiraceae bacterium]|nr:MBL fold metallo-hydrolase [Lachnospiraceae bacterium]